MTRKLIGTSENFFFFSPPSVVERQETHANASSSFSPKRSQSLSSLRVIIGMSSLAIKRKPQCAAGCEQFWRQARWKDGQAGSAATKQEAEETGEARGKWKWEVGGRLAPCASDAEACRAVECHGDGWLQSQRRSACYRALRWDANTTKPSRTTSPAIST